MVKGNPYEARVCAAALGGVRRDDAADDHAAVPGPLEAITHDQRHQPIKAITQSVLPNNQGIRRNRRNHTIRAVGRCAPLVVEAGDGHRAFGRAHDDDAHVRREARQPREGEVELGASGVTWGVHMAVVWRVTWRVTWRSHGGHMA
eukprot:3572357-Prymnesium_polylepis.1